ncbi:hypothetical protein A2866_06545 [Candidatus Roizmanbacteria bacterium RIFCSPHIGHO2_01_FULL_39_8]|uniref:Uncharacterized protein n=2 Tax=Candidatus Roizmaniibacteriota TaxID=1752723 RepID=A0A1F7GGX6_9BACT|nr:MAG: hypothetical protein A2866_06545 [Candidatus Roizmanbacteria bacterium RIFCSPHIGHO2_01_FULL_39_8]OGK26794.1 MAG: hypothetical protein A3C28_05365 [Candidatus Roizmanbacteria bacterium RIFCSPHIGHO2_02_FULL_39_9]
MPKTIEITPEQLERIDPNALNQLGQYIFGLLTSGKFRTYGELVQAINTPGVSENEMAAWVSGLKQTKRRTKATNTFEEANEFFLAHHLLQEVRDHSGINPKAQYLAQVFTEIDLARREFGPTNNKGIMKKVADKMKIHPQHLAMVATIVRFELTQHAMIQQDRIADQYLEAIRTVGNKKLSPESKGWFRLGKRPEDDQRLRGIAETLGRVGSIDDYNRIPNVPNEWLNAIFLESISPARQLLTNQNNFSSLDVDILERLSQGNRLNKIVQEVGQVSGLGEGPIKTWRNLLLYGSPTDIIQQRGFTNVVKRP